MISNLYFTVNAVMPIVLVILVGYLLQKIKMFDEDFFKKCNKICFRIFIPVLLLYNTYNIKSINDIDWLFILFIIISILIIFVLGFIFVKLFIKENKQKGVIHQCIFRSNYAIIGLPLAEAIGGSEALAIATIVSAFSIPLFNILAVIALSLYDKEENKLNLKSLIFKIIMNPLIHGVLAGLIIIGIRSILVNNDISFTISDNIPFLYKTIKDIALLASPLALIALGGSFKFAAVSKLKKQIMIGVSARLIIIPATLLFFASLFGYSSIEFPALIALFGTPVAVSSVPMACEMNQDDELAGQLVVWTSIFSAFTLFVIIFVCKNIGLL